MRHIVSMVLMNLGERFAQPTTKQQMVEAKVGILESLDALVQQSVFYVEARTDCLRADQELMKAELESQKASSQNLAQMVEVVKPLLTDLLNKYLNLNGEQEGDPASCTGDDLFKKYALPAYPQKDGPVNVSTYLEFLKKPVGDRVAWTGGPAARLEEVARELAYEGYGLRMETEAHGKTILVVDVPARGPYVASVRDPDDMMEEALNSPFNIMHKLIVVSPIGQGSVMAWIEQYEDQINELLKKGVTFPFSLLGSEDDTHTLAYYLTSKGYSFAGKGYAVNGGQPPISWCVELVGVPYGVAPEAVKPEEIPTVEALPTHDEDGKELSEDVLVNRYAREAAGRLRMNGGRTYTYVGENLGFLAPLLTAAGVRCDWALAPQKDGTLLMGKEERLTILSVPDGEQALSEGTALEFIGSQEGVIGAYTQFLSNQWGPAKSPVYVFIGGPRDRLSVVDSALSTAGFRCDYTIGEGRQTRLTVYLLPPALEAKLAELPKNRVG